MKVSICCITFNHEAYIGKALDGFLAQKFDGELEIIVQDDASADGTQRIIQQYADRDPRIKPILRTTNLMSTGEAVFPKLVALATGDYIALCEGDDHWIDPLKLQRQVGAMEADPEAAGCFTDAYNETAGIRVPYMNGIYAAPPKGRKVTQQDIITGQGIPTCTFMFRNRPIDAAFPIPRKALVEDVHIFTYISGFGHLIYLPDRTGVRLIHPGGVHSMKSTVHKLSAHLDSLPHMDLVSGKRYTDILTQRKRRALDQAWSDAVTGQDQELARYVYPKIATERKAYGWNLTTTWRNWSKAYMPWLDMLYARLTGK